MLYVLPLKEGEVRLETAMDTHSQAAITTVRYAIIIFLIIGIYPLTFDRIGTPKSK